MSGKLVIISAPSGGGKNAVIRALIERIPNSGQLVTTTTRLPRAREVDGVDYHFISSEEFARKIKNEEFLEYNEYTGNFYGTEKGELESCLQKYTIVFSQAEVNGKHALTKQGIPHLAIFLLPESENILENRIRNRGGTSEEDLKKRLIIAKIELDESVDYDLRIVNKDGDLMGTVDQIMEFIKNSSKT